MLGKKQERPLFKKGGIPVLVLPTQNLIYEGDYHEKVISDNDKIGELIN